MCDERSLISNDGGLDHSDLLDAFAQVVKALSPSPLYYIEMDVCERGQIMHVDEGASYPEIIVFHPDDFDEIESGLNLVGCRLVPARVWWEQHERSHS